MKDSLLSQFAIDAEPWLRFDEARDIHGPQFVLAQDHEPIRHRPREQTFRDPVL